MGYSLHECDNLCQGISYWHFVGQPMKRTMCSQLLFLIILILILSDAMKFFISIQACVKLIMGISIAPINNRRGGKSEFKKKK